VVREERQRGPAPHADGGGGSPLNYVVVGGGPPVITSAQTIRPLFALPPKLIIGVIMPPAGSDLCVVSWIVFLCRELDPVPRAWVRSCSCVAC
jgi:hypothetical protein